MTIQLTLDIRKAIAYFLKDHPDHPHFLENIECYLKDWTLQSRRTNPST
jgi:hypothetical protein